MKIELQGCYFSIRVIGYMGENDVLSACVIGLQRLYSISPAILCPLETEWRRTSAGWRREAGGAAGPAAGWSASSASQPQDRLTSQTATPAAQMRGVSVMSVNHQFLGQIRKHGKHRNSSAAAPSTSGAGWSMSFQFSQQRLSGHRR